MLSVIMLNVFCAECPNEVYYADLHYAECRYAECHFAQCRGALKFGWKLSEILIQLNSRCRCKCKVSF
jgi:hypothetical protein